MFLHYRLLSFPIICFIQYIKDMILYSILWFLCQQVFFYKSINAHVCSIIKMTVCGGVSAGDVKFITITALKDNTLWSTKSLQTILLTYIYITQLLGKWKITKKEKRPIFLKAIFKVIYLIIQSIQPGTVHIHYYFWQHIFMIIKW